MVSTQSTGKDTAGEILQRILNEQAGYSKYMIGKYANPLKSVAEDVFGSNFDDRDVKEGRLFVTPELRDRLIDSCDLLAQSLQSVSYDDFMEGLDETLFEETWLSPRDVQIQLGSVGRDSDPDVWVEYLRRNDTPMIVTDVRYPNELLDYNILITNDNLPVHKGLVHSSELMCNEFKLGLQDPLQSGIDYVISNNGSKIELETRLRFLATTIKH